MNEGTRSKKLKQLLLFIALIAISLFLSGLVKDPRLSYIPLGCLFVILSNWIMFRSEGMSFAYLGVDQQHRPVSKILIGFLLGLGFVFFGLCLQLVFRGGNLVINYTPDFKALLTALLLVLPTVVVQQFYIMGYGFYKATQLGGRLFAILLTSLVFMAMHDVWGNKWNIPFHLLNYFFAILIYANALQRSGSILLPIGLHWGNNFASSYLITLNETKTSFIFLVEPQTSIENYYQYFSLLVLGMVAPVALLLIIRLIYKNKTTRSFNF